jgi:hypothetical protein
VNIRKEILYPQIQGVTPPPPDPTRSDERLMGVLVVVEVEPALERPFGLQSELLRALLARGYAH